MFTILQDASVFVSKKIVLVDLPYPYGKSQVYMNSSLVAVAAQLLVAGHTVKLLDFNIGNFAQEKFLIGEWADVVGVSVVGSPDIPSAIAFARKWGNDSRKVMFGGQVIAGLDHGKFVELFGVNAVQITKDSDLAEVVGSSLPGGAIPSAFEVPFSPVWAGIDPKVLKAYLSHEFSVVISQGCIYKCAFCGAKKGQREEFVSVEMFESDMFWLASWAKRYGISTLQAYVSPLDFFQNPDIIAQYLRALADVQARSGVRFRIRCLSCTKSFLRASRKIQDFEQLVKASGLWCIGFGVDGTDDEVWRAQHKSHNTVSDVVESLDLCQKIGIRSEILMVMGFAQDNAGTLWKNFLNSIRYAFRWQNTMLRPYLAKPFIPGNDGWKTEAGVEQVIKNPNLFYNLDFCALGSRLTHSRLFHRWMCNMAYLAVIVSLTPFGRCCTNPLLPQGEKGWYGRLAKIVNRYMPFDR